MGPKKIRKNVEQPEFRKSRSNRKSTRRKFHNNQYTVNRNPPDDTGTVNNPHVNDPVVNNAVNNPPVNNSSVLLPSLPVTFTSSSVPDFQVVNNNKTNNENDDGNHNAWYDDGEVPGPSSHESSATGSRHPVREATLSEIKISFHTHSLEESILDSAEVSQKTPVEYVDFIDNEIMDMDILSKIITLLSCPECKATGIKLLHKKRYGLATKCKIFCPSCTFEKEFWSSRKVDDGGRAFQINQRLTYSMRSIGVGLKGSQTFLAMMNLPPPVNKSAHEKIVKNVHAAVKAVAVDVMKDASEEVRTLYIDAANEDGIVETSISCDGTWQKRGFTSLNGAVAVLSTETGKVLDGDIMSRYCNACTYNEKI